MAGWLYLMCDFDRETEESVIVDEKVEIPAKQVEQIDGNVVDSSKDNKKEEAAHEAEKEPEDNVCAFVYYVFLFIDDSLKLPYKFLNKTCLWSYVT